MTAHNANNSQCDLTIYGDVDGVHCTCDVDAGEPSTVIHEAGQSPVRAQPGQVVLTGRKAATYVELEAATRELDAARKLLAPAEARWRAAMDAHMAAVTGS